MVVFLSVPFSHPDSRIRIHRYLEAQKHVDQLAQKGILAICPVITFYDVAERVYAGELNISHEQWMDVSLSALSICKVCHVLQIEGWDVSVGVTQEIEYCKANGINLEFVYK